MSFAEEFSSWMFPPTLEIEDTPTIGWKAPTSEKLALSDSNGKATIIAFLRHCGCPFAEKTFKTMRGVAEAHGDIHFIAVSHSSESHTQKWLSSIGGAGSVTVVVDQSRAFYAQWGLGQTSVSHFLGLNSIRDIISLYRNEGIANRPTESGFRWQQSGTWAVDKQGLIAWGRSNKTAGEMPDFEEGVAAVQKGIA